ncbi:hypothetical protein DOZ80_17365 [Pseudomonas fluorescens]|uniref:Uncharacterized protein n=1 Tax=Pseudomonas fluorescens TaxID=294 RepID=A0A327MZ93_PSEFL|nr:hypothetical protein DOZ80_17365 [Pseudomonas fluorescens]
MFERQQAPGSGGVLEIAIAGKPAPTGGCICARLCRSRLAGDGGLDYAGAVATMSSIEAPASALRRYVWYNAA